MIAHITLRSGRRRQFRPAQVGARDSRAFERWLIRQEQRGAHGHHVLLGRRPRALRRVVPQMTTEQKRRRYIKARNWAVEHRDRVRELQAEWRSRNRITLRVKDKARRERDHVLLAERDRERHRANPRRFAEATRRWKARHPDRARARRRRWVDRRRAAGHLAGHHTALEWSALLAAYDWRCAHCGSTRDVTRDHVVPLSRGGSDDITNIQPLCRRCNSAKGAA